MIRGKSRDAWHASSDCVLLESQPAASQQHWQQQRSHQHWLPVLRPVAAGVGRLRVAVSVSGGGRVAAGVGYDVEAGGRPVV